MSSQPSVSSQPGPGLERRQRAGARGTLQWARNLKVTRCQGWYSIAAVTRVSQLKDVLTRLAPLNAMCGRDRLYGMDDCALFVT